MLKMLKRYFLAGLFVWLPVLVTLFVINFLVELLSSSLALIPRAYQPDVLLGYHIPGLGILLTLLVLIVTGLVATNFFGKKLLAMWEAMLARIPLVRSIHASVKQVMHTLFSSSGQSFRKVLLIQYPRKGLWTVAFLTNSSAELAKRGGLKGRLITVFVPTTPNPTSGFLVLVDPEEATELSISVDDALKMVISLGTIMPGEVVAEIADSLT